MCVALGGCHRTKVVHKPGDIFTVSASGRSQASVLAELYKRAARQCPDGYTVIDSATDSRSIYWRQTYGVTETKRHEATLVLTCNAPAAAPLAAPPPASN